MPRWLGGLAGPCRRSAAPQAPRRAELVARPLPTSPSHHLQAFVAASSTGSVARRRTRVVCAAAQPEGTSRRAALKQAAGLAAALLVSR